jgi:CheY-like chemotaxis protein
MKSRFDMSFLNASYLNSEEKKKFHGGTGEELVTQSNPLLAGKRCLVLDDEFLIALDIQQILEIAGAASVVCVGNSADAMTALRNALKFDLAVLDVKLSGATSTSLTVAAALAEQNTPFVFLTGVHGDDVHTKKFPTAPVVEKPYQAQVLMEAVLRALTSRRS